MCCYPFRGSDTNKRIFGLFVLRRCPTCQLSLEEKSLIKTDVEGKTEPILKCPNCKDCY